MAIRKIITSENPILRQKAKKIHRFDPSLQKLVDDMFETMHAANGVGLAAPQVGITQRIAVIWIPAEVEEREDGTRIELAPEESFVLINPQIVKASAGEDIGQEGCLSLPGWYGDVPRHSWVTVEYQDLDGKYRRIRKADDLLGRALQHEIDHLDGVLFTERMRDLSTLKDHRNQPTNEVEEEVI